MKKEQKTQKKTINKENNNKIQQKTKKLKIKK